MALFWQLTVNARDPQAQARFWAVALGYSPTPPAEPDSTWLRHYRHRLGDQEAFAERLFDPEGLRPPLWFQLAPDAVGGGQIHLDVYPTGRDDTLTLEQRVHLVDTKVDELVALGATVVRRTRGDDDPDDVFYFVTLADPEGNAFCVS